MHAALRSSQHSLEAAAQMATTEIHIGLNVDGVNDRLASVQNWFKHEHAVTRLVFSGEPTDGCMVAPNGHHLPRLKSLTVQRQSAVNSNTNWGVGASIHPNMAQLTSSPLKAAP